MDQLLALRPFVPAKDVEQSKKFYQALGFAVTLEDAEIVILKLGSFSFILQKFLMNGAAGGQAIQMLVRDADAWWRQHVDGAKLVADFGVKPPQAPTMQSWGLKVGRTTRKARWQKIIRSPRRPRPG
jgi:hypothetical protein